MYWLICFLTDRKCCNFVPQVKDTVICTSPPPITPPQKTTTIQPRNICENCVFTNISERHSDLYIPPPPPPPHHTTTTTKKNYTTQKYLFFTNISERHSDLYIPPITPPPPQQKLYNPEIFVKTVFSQIFLKDTVICTSPPITPPPPQKKLYNPEIFVKTVFVFSQIFLGCIIFIGVG